MRTSILSHTLSLTGLALLTAAAQAQTWTAVNNQPPADVSACVLLTDASVMCRSGIAWYKLTPDSSGSYVSGAWSTLASLPAGYNPALYGSAVLGDGRLALIGGQTAARGASSIVGAIYDPRTDSWQTLAAPADAMANELQCTGKVSTAVLPSGKLLVGAPAFRDLALLDPATLSWTAVSPVGKLDASGAARKGWTLLPDGSIFALDVADPAGSERLVLSGPSGGSWATAGNTLQRLHSMARSVDASIQATGCPASTGSAKRGPALLRPDGTIFAAGADGVTGIFIPPAAGSALRGAWRMGPATSSPLNFEDS